MSEALATAPTTSLRADPQNSAVAAIQQALNSGASPETLRELLAVRREWEADEARKAYFAAISEFQKRAPIIEKGDEAHGKQYARMDRIWRTVRPIASELGLSVTWQVCLLRDGICHVEGQLAHSQGHGVPLAMDVALPELIRGQNLAQQVGSARTYAQRYAFCAALGIVTGEDDDGHAAGGDNSPQGRLDRMREARNRPAEPSKPVVMTDVPDTIDPKLEEFLLSVNDATDGAELATLIEQANALDENRQRPAKRAIMAKATKLGLVWDKQSKTFIEEGRA